jgi:hypothetical protein
MALCKCARGVLLMVALGSWAWGAPPPPPPADLAAVRQEANPERRADVAFAYADAALDKAKQAYGTAGAEPMREGLTDIQSASELVITSLEATGQDPHKSRAYKKAEVSFRQLLRRLNGFGESVGFQDREFVQKVRDHVSDLHDRLLESIMEKKRK